MEKQIENEIHVLGIQDVMLTFAGDFFFKKKKYKEKTKYTFTNLKKISVANI